MKVNGKDYKTVWMEGSEVCMIEQNLLPFEFKIHRCRDYRATCKAIIEMTVRGAGAIGATAGYAMAQAAIEASKNNNSNYLDFITNAKREIESTRPTARNLFYATEKVFQKALISAEEAIKEAENIAFEDSMASRKIGEYGSGLIKDGYKILTHCNAGWLAFVDYGTALSPIYYAFEKGKNLFVWVDETRPRSQGARLTAWELYNNGIPFKVIPDNAAAFLMSKGMVSMCIVGADRIAANGDVANKIGTLEKAIIAKEFDIPFYVAAPISTFDKNCKTGNDIVIEERSEDEVIYQTGPDSTNQIRTIRVVAPFAKAFNPAFDVTPSKYITAFITEKGIITPSNLNTIL